MKYEDFLTQLENCIRSKEGKEVRIHVSHIIKNNGRYMDSISVMSCGEKVSPAVGLAPYYQKALGGMSVEQIADQILDCILHFRKQGLPNVDSFADFEKAGGKIVCRLIHYRKNQKLLRSVPHRKFLDLAVVYYYLLGEDDFSSASILIQNSHLELWGITPEELHARAYANTPVLLPYEFGSMMAILRNITGMDFPDEEEERCGMYVLSNRLKMFGAVNMIYTNVLEMIAGFLGEDFYLLPGSVHECIIVPVSMNTQAEELQEMVKDINRTQVEPEEFLSDSVYRYCRGDRSLIIAAEGQ